MKIKVTKDEFTKLYYEHPYHELSKILGVGYDTIRRYKNKLGLVKKTGRPKTTLEFLDD